MAASREPFVPSITFAWERHIPFLAWTIIPYWSSDVLYAAAFVTCRTRSEIDRLGYRLLAIQAISVCFFVLFPLRVTQNAPTLHGFYGPLFESLLQFDRPYNQAPSLHVSLAYILWRQFRGPFWGAWFLLIALSTITTYQHQFIDVPTGLWAGILVVALIPRTRRPESARPRLAVYYGLGSAILAAAAFSLRWWILLWPSFSLSLVAAAYVTGKVELLGKTPVWMWPYNAFAWINSKLWNTKVSEIANGVWIGRPDTKAFRSVVDLTAELPVRADVNVPMLDLAIPTVEQLAAGVDAVETLIDRRPTLICCALGYSRSAAVAAAWLVESGRSASVAEAVETIRNARPKAVLSSAMVKRLEEWAESRNATNR